jgi:hypothetical protein
MQNTFVPNHDKEPRDFLKQNRYYLEQYSDINERFQKKYNSFFDKPISTNLIENNMRTFRNARCRRIQRHNELVEVRNEIRHILRQYPTLSKHYNREVDSFVINLKNHKRYFHNHVFEELMKTVWSPKNFHKFIDWDPMDEDDF